MKPKLQRAAPREFAFADDRQVEVEIESFLDAVNSYPASVAEEPNLSFQEHLSSFFAGSRKTLAKRSKSH